MNLMDRAKALGLENATVDDMFSRVETLTAALEVALQAKNNPGAEGRKKAWKDGALMALSVLNSMFDQPTMCANVVTELGLGGSDCSDMDDFDKENMRLINENLGREKDKLLGLEVTK